MPQVSKYPLRKEVFERVFELLLKTIADSHTQKEATQLIDDLLTPTEKIMLAKRLSIAVLLAKNYGANTIINLSNINYAYDKDPKKYHDAKIIKEIKWSDFRHVVGYKWKPGLSAPFDPIASALAEKLKLKVIIANGANLKNFENFINKGKIKGTVVS